MTSTLPAWFTERQQAARARYESLPAPKRNDETWRFSNLKQLDFAGFEMAASNASAKDLIARSHGLGKTAAKFVFANDQLIHSECHVANGIVCLPLADALVSHSELVQAHFMKQETRLGSAKFAALHEASVANGLFVHVPDNTEVDGTIEVHHWTCGANTMSFPHTLVVTGKSSKVRVIDIFRSADELSPGVVIAYNDLAAGQNSQLDYVAIQAVNEVSRIIQIQRQIVKYLLRVVEHVSENDLPALNTHSEFLWTARLPERSTSTMLCAAHFNQPPSVTG